MPPTGAASCVNTDCAATGSACAPKECDGTSCVAADAPGPLQSCISSGAATAFGTCESASCCALPLFPCSGSMRSPARRTTLMYLLSQVLVCVCAVAPTCNASDCTASGETCKPKECGGAFCVSSPLRADVVINEIAYNSDQDYVEVVGPAFTDLEMWSIALYAGSGALYDTLALTGTIPDTHAGFGLAVVNGNLRRAQAGVALISADCCVLHFLSYGGALTASDGPAGGMRATDLAMVLLGDTRHRSLLLTNMAIAFTGLDSLSVGMSPEL